MNRREDAIALYATGLSCADIGKRLGAHDETVRRWLVRDGIARRPSSYVKPKPVPSWEEYFEPRTKREGNCLLWIKSRCKQGYGQCEASFAPKIRGAHRMSWLLAHGPFDLQRRILHKCDNPPCVNPDHLFIGTQADNMRDMHKKGRNRLPDQRGEANPIARLTDSEVREIRKLHRGRACSQHEIAEMFGVHVMTINRIVRRRSWAWLDDHEMKETVE